MRTAVIRVDEPAAAGSDHRIALLTDGGSATWFDEPVAEASMPADPADPNAPTDEAGQPLDRDAIVPYLVGQPDPSETFKAIGQYLLRQVAPGAVGAAWEALRQQVGAPAGPGLRTFLDIRPMAIRRLPWELAADAAGKRLFLDAANPWVRGSPPFAPAAAPDPGPLRVLIVIGSREDDIAGEEEVAAILPALRTGRGVAEVLRGPTQPELVAAYRELRPHVFHFIGHGLLLPGSGAVLKMGSKQAPWVLSDDEILNVLTGWTGRLAILNACRTDSAPTESHEASASLVEAFRKQGYRAVVGMQGDIRAEAASAFSRPFYGALGRGSPLDQALAEARGSMAQLGLGRRDWALPAMTIATDPAQVLVLDQPEPRVSLATPEFVEGEPFVGQGPERRGLWIGLDPELFDGPAHGLTLVAGEKEVGKTWLIKQVLWICALRGWTVRYVTLTPEPNKSLDFLAVLRRIRDGDQGSPLQAPLPREAFDRFNHQLNFIVRGKEPTSLEPPATPVPDEGRPFKAGLEFGIERIYESFVAALKTAAGPDPLVIALDQTQGVALDARAGLWNRLLRPAADGELGQVRIIMDIQGDDLGDWLAGAQSYPRTIGVDDIAIEDFPALALEYLTHRGVAVTPDISKVIDAYAVLFKPSWRPYRLASVFDSVRPR